MLIRSRRDVAPLAQLRVETTRAWQAVGTITDGDVPAEEGSRTFRRSLYIARDMKASEVLDESALRSVRPGYGLSPNHLETLIGKRVARDVKRGTPVSRDFLGEAAPAEARALHPAMP